MFCNKCGNEIKENQLYCSKCGNRINLNRQINLINDVDDINNTGNSFVNDKNTKNKITTRSFILIVSLGIILIIGLLITTYMISSSSKNKYSFDDEIATDQSNVSNNKQTDNQTTVQPSSTKGKYKTDIITDNMYMGLSIKSVADAKDVIVQDSVEQKQADYPKEIIEIENHIIEKYGITAVNLKEMEVEFAKELENVIDDIWKEYPKAREHLTNLTLTNLKMTNKDTIALFMPLFTFGTSNTNTTRPWIIKTQIQLNSRFFLNIDKLDTSVQTGSQSGHFPKNATRYSPVAHELGHYLSFIALLNYYSTDSVLIIEDNQIQDYYNLIADFSKGTFSKKMLNEAYQNYVQETNDNIDFDEWRGKISKYALAKDSSGNYIYDETIAEAFHDAYLNGNNATIQSKYIVEVLKKYVGK